VPGESGGLQEHVRRARLHAPRARTRSGLDRRRAPAPAPATNDRARRSPLPDPRRVADAASVSVLPDYRLSGSIPALVGRLTALTVLYDSPRVATAGRARVRARASRSVVRRLVGRRRGRPAAG
jgi:hypothetical protein